MLRAKAEELDKTIRKLDTLRNGLLHAAACPAPSHTWNVPPSAASCGSLPLELVERAGGELRESTGHEASYYDPLYRALGSPGYPSTVLRPR
jgi:hypothetical protein